MRFDLKLSVAAVLLLGGIRCIGEVSSLSGSSCMTDLDCPGTYACLVTGLEGARTCQALVFGGPSDPEGPAPGTPYYCEEIKPILDTYCTACHGSNRTASGLQTMRFDQYDNDAEGVLGAKAAALRIRVRTSDFADMPPKTFAQQPSDAERAAVKRWEAAGAPRCEDDPSVGSPDGGEDGGSIGGGGNDGGTIPVPGGDAGVPNGAVSYSKDVQPILNAYCTGCHTAGNPRGNLNLDPGVSRGELLNVPSGCNNQVVNVKAADPQGSMLWRKIMGDPTRCNAVMPTNGALNSFDPEAADVIERWIQQGALNN
ncbi:MAG: hypothetical protein WBV82_00300 [Myxococcaceae bacterium]